MRRPGVPILLAVVAGAALAVALVGASAKDRDDKAVDLVGTVPDRPDYNWDVRPILSQNCFACHGQGVQKAGLRLDLPDAAFGELPENPGHKAIVKGNPKKSELFKRISSTDTDFRMPPKETHKVLTEREVEIMRRWIKQGAKYKQHWAYIAPKEVKPGKSPWKDRVVNPIDAYVFARLEKEGLAPSPEADRETLINRVTLDLTGLPPTLAEVDAFVADKRPDAYERLVDRLIGSRQYAERQANVWLDVARYADSDGYLNDGEGRFQHPYRDWVITAFQRNIPYDRFVTWQLAGDKLPNPTREQVLATAFTRAGKKSNEGGIIDEEYRVEYVMERTELVGKAFLGLTVGCAKCHDHKYDVISQADYYSMSGFFNSVNERGIHSGGGRSTPMGPVQAWPTPKQSRELAGVHAATVGKEALYQAALAQARKAAAPKADAMMRAAPAQRTAFLAAAMQSDIAGYYPLDSGYKASFEPLMIEPSAPLGAAPRGGRGAGPPGLTRTSGPGGGPPRLGPGGPRRGPPGARPPAAAEAAARPAPAADQNETAPDAPKDQAVAEAPAAPAPAAAPAEAAKSTETAAAPRRGPPPGFKPGSFRSAAGGPPPGFRRPPGAGPRRGPPGGPPGGRPGGPPGVRPNAPGGAGAFGAPPAPDPDMPRVAGEELNVALRAEVAKGLVIGNALAILKRQLKVGLKEDKLFWTPSGLPDGPPGYINNITFVPGAKGQGVLLNNSVVSFTDKIAQFERTDPYTLDVWTKLRTGKPYEDAVILSNSGRRGSNGYALALADNRLQFEMVHGDPYNMLAIETLGALPTGRWLHLTATYDGNSRAGGMKLYINGTPLPTKVTSDRLTRSTRPRGGDSQLGSYYGLQSGKPSGALEMIGGAVDELRVYTRALTPIEVAQLHSPALAARAAPDAVRAQLIEIAAAEDPKVKAAWADLTAARLDEQRTETPIYQMMVLADRPSPRKTFVLDHGVYNQYRQEVPTQGLGRVYKWDAKLPRDRLGLTQWLFDPKHPLTSRVYVNRMWQTHFGTGIVDTVEDFGTQGSNPSHPELLDWLAIEFVRSGWDMKHMHKLMVMSATYRQSSTMTPGLIQKDPVNRLLAHGPRFRMPAEMIRDNALFASGLLVDKPGGDSVFPYQPPGVWDSAGVGVTIYPTAVPDDQMHRRSMYTFWKRNAPPPSLMTFDMADRNGAQVARKISNTPLQALVLLNDPQYIEAYRKLAERAMRMTSDPDKQLVDTFRLATRRHPSKAELAVLKDYRTAEVARLTKAPAEATKLEKIGVAKPDPKVDPIQLAAMTMVTAAVMNSPDAYSLR